MNENREARRVRSTVELARTDPEQLYGADYYESGYATDTALPYSRAEPWLGFFGSAARKIKKRYRPRNVADVGCAFGMLVESLNDLGVPAWGFDVSPYAISQARDDMRGRLAVHSLMDPIPVLCGEERYDLITCIEVLEHLPPEATDAAISNLCAAADRVLFSSSPDDFDEPTHFNVRPTEEWIALFEAQGFRRARLFWPGFLSPHAFVMERPERAAPIAERMTAWFYALKQRGRAR